MLKQQLLDGFVESLVPEHAGIFQDVEMGTQVRQGCFSYSANRSYRDIWVHVEQGMKIDSSQLNLSGCGAPVRFTSFLAFRVPGHRVTEDGFVGDPVSVSYTHLTLPTTPYV